MYQHLQKLAVAAAVVVLVAGLASFFRGGIWLTEILQARWSPPAWVFVIGWTVFFLFQALAAALAGVRLGRLPPRFLLAWSAQWLLHLGWCFLVFQWHRPGWALPVLLAYLLVCIETYRVARASGARVNLFFPCMVWLMLVLVWNIALWRISGGGLDTVLPG